LELEINYITLHYRAWVRDALCMMVNMVHNYAGLSIFLLVLQTVEHHHTVRDSQGNEEITVTQQIGDKRYSVTTHIDSRGDKQQIENFVNIEKGNSPIQVNLILS
jgi:hypothetical protein